MVSIIIPVFNRAHLINETLISIQNQTYENWECIIIDDGSTDSTTEVVQNSLQHDSRLKLYRRPKSINKGPSACRNYGISKCLGDFIQFFDSDDIMHPDHLMMKINEIKDADIAICKIMPFNRTFKSELFKKETSEVLKTYNNNFIAFAKGELEMMMVAPLWKKKVLEKFLPIREDLHLLEDHELHARALFANININIINKTLIYYRTNSASTTHNFYKNLDTGLDSYLLAKSTVLNLSNNSEIKLAILKNVLGYFRSALASRNFKAANLCLNFIKINKLLYNFELKLKLIRIEFFYQIFKIFKKGDTFFKPLFKL